MTIAIGAIAHLEGSPQPRESSPAVASGRRRTMALSD
jgi:hypothetical protein